MDQNIEDLRTLSQIGQALWADPDRSERAALDSLGVVSTLELPMGRLTERTGAALLHMAYRDGISASASALQNPFFRLSPEERLTLAALHLGKWTYERVGRVLGKTPDQVSRMAWSARLELMSAPGVAMPAPHPTGSPHQGLECPEYNASSPWTQSFLDEELSTRDRMFLRGHLLACGSCRQALSRARSMYYAVAAMIPPSAHEEKRVRAFEKVVRSTRLLRYPLERGLGESLLQFVSRAEVLRVIVGGGALLLWLSRSR